MRTARLILLATVGLALSTAGIAKLIRVFFIEPQHVEAAVRRCCVEISNARSLQAQSYAPEQIARAEATLNDVMARWRAENQRWFLKRDLTRVIECASRCAQEASRASGLAVARKDSLKNFTAVQLSIVKEELCTTRRKYKSIPMSTQLRRHLAESEMMISQSEAALKRNEYHIAAERMAVAHEHIAQFSREAFRKLSTYFESIPQWRIWVAETIEYSRAHKSSAILIDKLAHVCRAYLNGRLMAEYPADFGPNWIGPKRCQGDKATPEGKYRVTLKKGHGQTRYHRALELDYPNEIDRERFRRAKMSGELPSEARIGGLLEIHGGGGRGVNWTNGCVSLSNKDMEKLFDMIPVGTPVTIVGTVE